MLTLQKRYTLPADAREIILARHGSSDASQDKKLLLGDRLVADPPLMPAGHEQASALAERLRHEPISRLYVTQLKRTWQTAAPLAALLGMEPVVVAELREAHLGDYEHDFPTRAAAGDPLIRQMLVEETWAMIPNAEPVEGFRARVRSGVQTILAQLEPGATAVAFIHGGTIGEICRQASGSRPMAFIGAENGSLSRLVVYGDGRWAVRVFNDAAHLGSRAGITSTPKRH
jgi:2,3-bisphosphoglycerate-dependent phosphoglycerate mutase